MNVTVWMDTSDMRRRIAQLRTRTPQAITRALNRSIVSARVVMVRAVSKDIGLKQGAVKARISTEEAKPGIERARLSASAKQIPVILLRAKGPEPSRGKGSGVTYRIGGRMVREPHAFIATMPKSGHRGVFQREPGAHRRGDRKIGRNGRPYTTQLGIKQVLGPSIADIFVRYEPLGLARGQEQLVKNLQSEFRFALRSLAA